MSALISNSRGSMKLKSFGAVEGVTGSCHMLEVGDKRVLLDCGMFQGSRDDDEENRGLGFDPKTLDAVIVSHAHLDHIGRLPILFKQGFRGPIYSTRATYDLAKISLLDSARLQEFEVARANRKRPKGTPPKQPIYDDQDVLDLLDLWDRWVKYEEPVDIFKGVKAKFSEAGHILGSAFLTMDLQENDKACKFIFSGDLGNVGKPIIHDPSTPGPADVVLMESTYGDRNHRPFGESIDELLGAIEETFKRGGNVVIPTFALERAQELLYVLYEAWRDGKLAEDATIYLDSPMAISATRVFERYPDLYDSEAMDLHNQGETPFDFPALRYTRETRDSMSINEHRSKAIILAGSGMANGGRVIHHLRHNLYREECSVIFCGFQARGTLGRKIVDGADFVHIHGHTVPIVAQVYTINGFSAHAGQEEMTQWANATDAKKILLVHGEEDVKERFRHYLLRKVATNNVDIMPAHKAIDLSEWARSISR